MAVSRRDFLKATAATGALTAALADMPWIQAEEAKKGGWPFENRIPSVCALCPGNCGILARTHKKRLVHITGNPFHPVNAGGICPRGIAGTQVLYNPDRIRGPMRRASRSGTWEKISWDEAIKIVAQKLAELRGNGLSHTVVGLSAHYRGALGEIAKRFFRVYGSPNLIDIDDGYLADPAVAMMQGFDAAPIHNIEKSSLVLSINGDFLDAAGEPVQMMRAYGLFRSKQQKRRGKLIHAGPRLSLTASKADEWIPLKSGTEGAFALGVAHMLLKERLHDEAFVNAFTQGFGDWKDGGGKPRDGLRTLILKEYSPAAVSRITGVAIETIIRVAREFARMKPAVAMGSHRLSHNYQGLFTRMAIHSLNVLNGAIDAEGGILFARSLPESSSGPAIDKTAEKGLAMPGIAETIERRHPLPWNVANSLAQSCSNGTPYKHQAVLLFDANPAYHSLFADDYHRMLDDAGFVVSFSSFFDESTQCADIVLPNHTYLERWGDAPTHTTSGFPVLGLQQPVVAPFYDTRNSGDVLIAIAQAMGEDLRKAVWETDYLDFVKARFRTVYEAPRGDIFGPPHEAAWTRLLERSGWKASAYDSFESFWKALTEKGGWWEPIYYHQEWNRVIKTASRRIEFAPQKLVEAGISPSLPHHEPIPVKSSAMEYPLMLNIFSPLVYFHALDANIPWVQASSGRYINFAWGTWVEVHPETAGHLGIKNNDKVIVESSRGRIRATARIFSGTMPDVVSIPAGMGRKSGGRWQKEIGTDPLEIVEKATDPASGETLWNATRVKILKA